MAREIISRRQYIQHWDYAVPVIEAASRQNNISLEQVTFQHIIRYFEQTYNLHFMFFEKDPFPMLPSAGLLSSEYIKYRGLVNNPDVTYLDDIICKHNDGFTIYSKEKEKYLVYINQTHIKRRIIFTILHELAHIAAHFSTGRSNEVALACANNYQSNPLEIEANTMASLFYINNERMVWHLKNKHSYEQIKQANTISDNALFNRLVDFVHYRILNYDEYLLDDQQQRRVAIDLVTKYKRGNNILQQYYDIDV